MRILNGKDTLGLSVDFAVKTIDIDFYNTINRTLFLGHKNDSYLTQLHLIVPTLDESSGIYVSFYNNDKQESIGTFIVTSVEIGGKTEYYFPITNGEITSEPHKGYLQFFIVKNFEDNNEEEQIIASSERIKYIIEDSLTIESDQEYVTSIITYLNNNVVNWGNRLTEAEEDIRQLTNDLTNKINKNTNLVDSNDNEVLLYDKNNVYKASGKMIGGNTFSNQKTKTLATEQGVEKYVENELKKVATSDNSMMFEDTNNSIPATLIKSNLIRTGFLGGEKGLIFSATAQDVEKSAELFLGILGSLKTRNFNSTIPNAWSDWKNVEREGNVPVLTQEMYDKINAALTDATEWVENNENKKRNEIPDNYENDIVSYPSMATLGAFYNDFVEPLLSDINDIKATINGINSNITNINTNLLNKMSKMPVGSADKLLISTSLGEATRSEKSIDDSGTFYSNESSRNQRIPTEQVIVNYINSLGFATQEEIEAIDTGENLENLVKFDTNIQEEGIQIQENEVTIESGVVANTTFNNLLKETSHWVQGQSYFLRIESEIACRITFKIRTNNISHSISKRNSQMGNNLFIPFSYGNSSDQSDDDILNQISITVLENASDNKKIRVYLFSPNDMFNKIEELLQDKEDRIKILEDWVDNIPDLSSVSTFSDLEKYNNSITNRSKNNPFILENTEITNNGLSVKIINNNIILNGELTEDTTFNLPTKKISVPMLEQSQQSKTLFLILKGLNQLRDTESVQIPKPFLLNLESTLIFRFTYNGTSDNTQTLIFDTTDDDLVFNDYGIVYSSIPQMMNNIETMSDLTFNLSQGNYNNIILTFSGYYCFDNDLDYDDDIVDGLIRKMNALSISPVELKTELIPETITTLPDKMENLEEEIGEISDTLENVKIGETTLSGYDITDAYTKDEIEQREDNFVKLEENNYIAFKNKMYTSDGLTVEVSEWNKFHISGTKSGITYIPLDILFLKPNNHNNTFLYIKDIDTTNISDEIIGLNFQYVNDDTSPLTHSVTHYLPNVEDELEVHRYPSVTIGDDPGSTWRNNMEFSQCTLVINNALNIDYTFEMNIYNNIGEEAALFEPPTATVLLEKLGSALRKEMNNYYNVLYGSKVDRLTLFEDNSVSNLIDFGTETLASFRNSTVSVDIDTVTITPITAGTGGTINKILDTPIILNSNTKYLLMISGDNLSNCTPTFKFLDDQDTILKTYSIASGSSIFETDSLIYLSNKTISKISITVNDGYPSGTFTFSLIPDLGFIKEEVLGLERFIENGEIDTPLKYSSSTAYRLTGTYRLKDGFCYLTAQADCYPGWTVMYYDLPVAPIEDATVLGCNATRLYEVSARALHPDSQEASSLAIIPLERKFSPNPSTDVYASGDPINITICYKYR